MFLRGVGDGVGRIEPKAVDMKFPAPIAGILDKEIAHGLEFKIEPITPGSLVFGIEIIAAITAEIVAVGPEMVVDHVEDHGETACMSGVDQRPQVVRHSVGCGPARRARPRRNPSSASPENPPPA